MYPNNRTLKTRTKTRTNVGTAIHFIIGGFVGEGTQASPHCRAELKRRVAERGLRRSRSGHLRSVWYGYLIIIIIIIIIIIRNWNRHIRRKLNWYFASSTKSFTFLKKKPPFSSASPTTTYNWCLHFQKYEQLLACHIISWRLLLAVADPGGGWGGCIPPTGGPAYRDFLSVMYESQT